MDFLPLNTLTLSLTGLSTIGKTLIKHYINRKKITDETKARESLLYDEAFSVMRWFFDKSMMHTVEEMQAFGNNFVPAPFWVRVIRVTVPLSTRIDAGKYLIAGLGDDDIENVVGGREWWQRTSHPESGVCGEWISLKRDWEGLEAEAKAQRKERSGGKGKDGEKELEERLRQLKEEGREDAKRRREAGKGRLRATSSATLSRSTPPDELESDCRAASSQRQAHGGEAFLDRTATHHHEEENWTSDLDDMPVTLAIHGGAHFFGSTNTHRYWYWRLARKTEGRLFSVDYRLSPQFPFPCALHDCLAAYLYLIRPPPGAKHRAVDPARITICGDSAGGTLAVALLCLIRDAGLPAPAGAMLISPWVDLTHSFPSILQNTATDIPPPYGFSIFKPSTLWPPPPPEFRKRAAESTSLAGLKKAAHKFQHGSSSSSPGSGTANPTVGSAEHHGHRFGTLATHNKAHELADAVENLPEDDPQRAEHSGDAAQGGGPKTRTGGEQNKAELAHVIKVTVDGQEVELVDQIQLYATNEQLAYAYVSPIWQPSLGGLPPLYIQAGDKEVLRDEIVFLAHRAAHPDRYPVRESILKQNAARTEKAKSYPSTKVHLQIYDEVCHDLPLFSFTTPAKYCYRAMASFAKWVTTPAGEQPGAVPSAGMRLPVERDPGHPDGASLGTPDRGDSIPSTSAPSVRSTAASARTNGRKQRKKRMPLPPIPNLEKTIYSGTQPFNRPDYVDNMIRERVSMTGVVRPMEPESEMSMLQLDPEDIGLIKEDAARRYLAGKAIVQRKFKKTYEKVQQKRERHLKKSMREEATRITKRVQQLEKEQEQERKNGKKGSSGSTRPDPSAVDPIQPERVTHSPEPLDPEQQDASSFGLDGVWNLHGERPPPSSLAGRKDTAEARKLAKVLDEHYSRLHGLALWSQIQDLVGPFAQGAAERTGRRETTSTSNSTSAPSAGAQLGTTSQAL
ncbi:hypothetical protein JCM3775_001058 [Rhodotorula graminis]